MAAATTIIAAATAAVSIGKAIHDTSAGNRQAKKAERDIKNYQRQEPSNVYSGLSMPTASYELQRTGIMQSQAEAINALSQAGARGAIGGSPKVMSTTMGYVGDLSARLEEAKFRIDQLKASDEARIQQMRETREQEDLAGLGAQAAYGRSLASAGTNQLVSTGASIAELSMDTEWGNKKLWGNGKQTPTV